MTGILHPNAKIVEDDVREIRRRLKAGEGITAIARSLAVSYDVVNGIKRNKTWVHVR